MKVNVKKIATVLMIIILLINCTTTIFATVNIDKINDKANIGGANEISEIGSYIYSGITSIGIVAAVIVVAILGVKYMMGSAEERAEYKKSMMPYLIGAFLVFAASTIAKAVVSIAQ